MRRRVGWILLLACGLLGGWGAAAAAEIPPLPPVPPVPKVPTLPVLPPTPPPPAAVPVPKVPPAPVQVPKAPAPAVPAIAQPSQPQGAAASPGTPRTSTPSYGAQRSPARRPARVYWLHLSRDWITRRGPKKQRHTTLTFVLRRAALVEFVVIQVSPDCRRVGRFRVRGREGLNRVRFRGRIGRTVLRPGTYRIQAKSGRQRVVDTRLVVVSRPNGAEIGAARTADACRAAPQTSAASSTDSTGPSATRGNGEGTRAAVSQPGTRPEAARSSRNRGALGARFSREAVEVVKRIPVWLYALLGVAIALLALAALPLRATPSRDMAFQLARRRGTIAVAGAATLLMVTVAYLLY